MEPKESKGEGRLKGKPSVVMRWKILGFKGKIKPNWRSEAKKDFKMKV